MFYSLVHSATVRVNYKMFQEPFQITPPLPPHTQTYWTWPVLLANCNKEHFLFQILCSVEFWIFFGPYVSTACLSNELTGRSGWIGRAHAFRAAGREFESRSSQSNDVEHWFLSLISQVLGMNRIGQGLVSSLFGLCDIRSGPGLSVGQHYKVAMSSHCHKSVPVLVWP